MNETTQVHDAQAPAQLLKVPQVAEVLNVGETTVWRLIKAGELKINRIGRIVLVPIGEVNAYIQRNTDEWRVR